MGESTMAETVHLFLKANGTDVSGESTQTSLGRENSIECLSFEDSVRTAREKGTGMATGRRTYEPIVFRKRIDKSSPLLAKALCNNEVIEATFKFFRPNPNGDGTTEQFFTVEIAEGRVAHIKRVSPDTIDPASAQEPPTEEVGLVFHTITWTYEQGGVTHTDNWREGA
jgi:type VI secretion system secreted protein Hcp